MTRDLVSTDMAIEQLTAELTTLKSTTQQLADAAKVADAAVTAAQSVTTMGADVVNRSAQQLGATEQLHHELTNKLDAAATQQARAIAELKNILQNDLNPTITRTQKTAKTNRALLILLLLLTAANLAVTVWLQVLPLFP